MSKIEPNNHKETVCNFEYLSNLMGGKIHLIKEIMDTFLVQVQEELKSLNDAITKKDYVTVKNLAHTMKSTVSIMGISTVIPDLQEMESLATGSDSQIIEKITALNQNLNTICKKAIVEIENYKFS